MKADKLGSRGTNIGKTERQLSVLLGVGLLLYGLRRSLGHLLLMALGGVLVYRGVKGHSYLYELMGQKVAETERGEPARIPLPQGARVLASVTVNRPRMEVYRFWRDLKNLPRIMRHLESVTSTRNGGSHWVAVLPMGMPKLEWDAQIIDDRPGERISWGSLPGSVLNNAGTVTFDQGPGDWGTEVHLTLEYSLPGGAAGATVSRLLGKVTEPQLQEDMRRFKSMMEAGEVATTEGQPSGRASTMHEEQALVSGPSQAEDEDVVEMASEDSFPASDPPSWNMGQEDEGID